MKKDTLSITATVILVLCAVLVTGLVLRREIFLPPPATEPRQPRPIENWEALVAVGHVLGPPDAPVTVLEFSDFQCPFCKRVQPTLDKLRAKYPQRVRIIYRHLPLTSLHPYAVRAALAAECAAVQGKFKAYHDALFEHQDSIGIIRFDELAKRARVSNLAAFRTCLREEHFRDRVERDRAAALDAELRATPSIIVAGTLLPGTPTFAKLDDWIQEALVQSIEMR